MLASRRGRCLWSQVPRFGQERTFAENKILPLAKKH
jgi:hypothetical protein